MQDFLAIRQAYPVSKLNSDMEVKNHPFSI